MCWINWGRGFHCLLSVIRFRQRYMLFQMVTMTNHPSRRQILFSIYWDFSLISVFPVMYRLVPKPWTTEHSSIPSRRLSKEQVIAHSLADSNAPSKHACSPALNPLFKLGILKYFFLVFWWNKVRILLQHLLKQCFSATVYILNFRSLNYFTGKRGYAKLFKFNGSF